VLKLARSMPRYDFSKEPLFSADIVIEKSGLVCKDRHGKAGRPATELELESAKEVKPNR
jgi:hypothetical protein